ncbi:Acetyl-coenzyme A synthetase [Patulibacter medicamentivorans]|uniref:Acetyl-coenzyme A synthetase n=1 Tax=Patulibacter medicamentivorans TaxID=1097667 RepID=H0E4Z8_9ACTN|nr:AMP-binding protein [Patulibacter medicamentivorans]EHN11249.1 Acetyl-coenzyme A synthetase [Patulibacter medicamentivorans]
MNFARDVVGAHDPRRRALVERARDGARREWSFGDVTARGGAFAGTLEQAGVGRGDVVMTLVGNRPEWVFAMVACFRLGAVVLPCTEQLRAKDLALRIAASDPRAIVCDERNRTVLEQALGDRDGIAILEIPDAALFDPGRPAPPHAELAPADPCLITFTSGTAGEPKPVLHAQRYLTGQALQAEHWLAPAAGELVWCTAASGWSKSARNVFIAPWLRGAAGLLHDARFDPAERLAIVREEQVAVLCMAPTEYRIIAKRTAVEPCPSLHGLVAAGEALNPEVLDAWRTATGLEIRDGFGQTETGQLTANPADRPARPASMGLPLPGVRLWIDDGELVVDPATVPTFFSGYLGRPPHPRDRPWRTGDRVRQDDDGYLYFEARTDDVIISAGYRIGPFEVESAMLTHPAVAEVGVVAAADPERGSVVRAVVVLREGHQPGDPLVAELQEHVRRQTAPYKYPRIVEFRDALPMTTSGKLRRAALRAEREPPGR